MTLNVSLDVFEGPFDLLFHLIEKNRIDIYDIPIAELTEQYLDYIGDISKNELDLTSGFLVMAATLLSIKSRMLLPSSRANEIQSEVALTVDEDPRSDLMTRLLEYKKYEEISNVLKEKEQEQRLIFKRTPEDLSYLSEEDFSLSGITLMDLINSFESVTNKNKSKKRISTISKITMTLSRKIAEVYRKLKQSKLKTSFCKLYDCRASRLEIITTFLAVLELIKMNRIFANQKKQFKRIDLVFRRHEI